MLTIISLNYFWLIERGSEVQITGEQLSDLKEDFIFESSSIKDTSEENKLLKKNFFKSIPRHIKVKFRTLYFVHLKCEDSNLIQGYLEMRDVI